MRFSPTLEHRSFPFLSSGRFRSFSARFLGLAIAAVVMLGVGVSARSAAADPLPDDVLAATFAWVVDDETAQLAYYMASSITDDAARVSAQDYLLLTILVRGGNPWKLNPNWIPPTGP
jgi:hypothetical protein